MRKKIISIILLFVLLTSPLFQMQKPAYGFFLIDDFILGLAYVGGAVLGMTELINRTNKKIDVPDDAYQKAENGYGIIITPDVLNPVLSLDGESNIKVRAIVKKDGNILEALPGGIKIFAQHTSSQDSLIQINSSDQDYNANGAGEICVTRIRPRYGTPNANRSIEYYIDPAQHPNIISVTMNIYRSAGKSLVYSRTESLPLNNTLMPFTWNNKSTDGEVLSAGEYVLELSLLKSNGENVKSPAISLFINNPIGSQPEELKYAGYNTYLLVTAPGIFTAVDKDTISFIVKDDNEGGKVVAEGKLDISFKTPASTPNITPNTLDFSSSLRIKVDGVAVKVENPGAKDEIIRVTAFDGDPVDEVQYEYNVKTKNITMKWKTGSRTYGSGNKIDRDAYYSILRVMEDLIRSAYGEAGITYNVFTKQLTIDKGKYVNKIDPKINVSTATTGNQIAVKLTKGDNTLTCNYDLSSGLASFSQPLSFASNYDMDYISGTVAAAAVPKPEDAFLDNAENILAAPNKLIYSLTHVIAQLVFIGKDLNTKLQPMARLEDPEITDINWINKKSGLINIIGKATVEKSDELTVYINGNKLTDPVSWSGKGWNVVNYSHLLQFGENKINAIIRKDDQREAESGDVTVYKGYPNQPDLILLSPRDREIIESNFSNKSNIEMKGKTNAGLNLTIVFNGTEKKGLADSSGKFVLPISMSIVEGNNIVSIVLSSIDDKPIEKTIIGAFKYIVSSKPKAFVLREGDIAFNLMALSSGKTIFNLIPFAPDHTGIYIGDQKISEATWDKGIKTSSVGDWNNSGFYCATQVPKLIDETTRNQIVTKVMGKTDKGYQYDVPISLGRKDVLRFSLKGKYDGAGNDNKFYCSELAYWALEEVNKESGVDFGIKLEDVLYPARGTNDKENNSILPAYLCEKTMEVRRVAK